MLSPGRGVRICDLLQPNIAGVHRILCGFSILCGFILCAFSILCGFRIHSIICGYLDLFSPETTTGSM